MRLSVWLKEGHTVEVVQRLGAEFTAETGVELDVAAVPESAAHDLLVGGEVRPDVVTLPFWYAEEVARRGLVEPVPDAVDLGEFEPTAVAALSVDGTPLAVPHTLCGGMLCYREDLTDAPRTTDDVLRIARDLGRPDRAGLLMRTGPDFSSLAGHLGWAWANGERLLPDAGEPDAAPPAELLDVLARSATGADDYARLGTRMAAGGAVQLFDTSAWAPFLEAEGSAVRGRVGYTTVTGPVAPAQFLYAEGLAVTTWCRDRDAARALLRWRHSARVRRFEVERLRRPDLPHRAQRAQPWYEAAVERFGYTGYVPALERSWREIALDHVPRRADFVAVARRLMTEIHERVRT
ncbi:ABC transporter substrate-binding protein [Saccharothrix obliqua]|uniref:ABC transporter substrate-binding protein n=1 Tax=Saccharothrix obliqua TaxID=2861747 RepID=UPI001C606DEC|nr:extracellular solute-binding protein [Saccharothrix obliqua]MBW4721383.1 extracellular solute-binding protein [Saccharothrix obliqua]